MKKITSSEARNVVPSVIELSELLVINTLLGSGYTVPGNLDDTQAWVVTAATSPDLHDAIREAECKFVRACAETESETRNELEHLESVAAQQGGGRGDPGHERIKILKERLKLHSLPFWRDSGSDRATMVETLVRSRFSAVSFLDELGLRLNMTLVNGFSRARDLSWISMTSGKSSDAGLIRSSGTGGRTVNSLVGKERSYRFRWISCPNPSFMKRVGKMVRKESGSPVMGHALLLPVSDNVRNRVWDQSLLDRALSEIYVRGEKGREPIEVGFSADTGPEAWAAHVVTLSNESPLPGQTATNAVVARLVVRALVTRAIMRHLESGTPPELNLQDFSDAVDLFEDARLVTSTQKTEDNKVARINAAREARTQKYTSPAAIIAASMVLDKAIAESEAGMVSRKTALSLPGVTSDVLDVLSNGGGFRCVTGKKNIRMGTTQTAYALIEQSNMDPEEVQAEFAEGMRMLAVGEAREPSVKDLADFREAATNNMKWGLQPCVQLDTLSHEQIRMIPAMLAQGHPGVTLRGAPGFPDEREELFAVPGEEEEDKLALRAGVPNLWFKTDATGKDLANWKARRALGFPEWGTEEAQP